MIDKDKLIEYLRDANQYDKKRSKFLSNLIHDLESGYFDVEGEENA